MKGKKLFWFLVVVTAFAVSPCFNPLRASANPWIPLIQAVQLSNTTTSSKAVGSNADLSEEERRQVERVNEFVENAKRKAVDVYAKSENPIAVGDPYEIVPLNAKYCVLTYECLVSRKGKAAIEPRLLALLIQTHEPTKYRYYGMAVALTYEDYQRMSKKDLGETFEGRYKPNIGPLEDFERVSLRKLKTKESLIKEPEGKQLKMKGPAM